MELLFFFLYVKFHYLLSMLEYLKSMLSNYIQISFRYKNLILLIFIVLTKEQLKKKKF